jgi:hypothetical protein
MDFEWFECKGVLKLLTEYDEHISPIALAFQDLWIRAIALMPKEWSLRFGKNATECVRPFFGII